MAERAGSGDSFVGVVVIFRHGARGLVKSSAAGLRSHAPTSGESHACSAWSDDEFEHITEVGLEQMRQLGRWLSLRYLPRLAGDKQFAELQCTPPKWRSSITPRVIESGKAVMEGLSENFGGTELPTAPQPYSCDDEADFVFRNWHRDSAFMAATKALRESEGMKSAAIKSRKELEALYGALSGAIEKDSPAASAAAGSNSSTQASAPGDVEGAAVTLEGIAADDGAIADALDNDVDDAQLGKQLMQTTYVKELWDCEAHWPATALALRNGLIKPGDRANEAGLFSSDAASTSTALPVAGNVKAALLRRLSPESEQFMRRAARWVWEQRYLAPPMSKPFAAVIGGPIVREAVRDLAAAANGGSGTPQLCLYSAHDYTLLSILSALRVTQHPADLIGFGSFIVIEAHRDAAAAADASVRSRHPGVSLTVRMCPDPFPRARDGHPTDFSPAGLHVVCEGVALDSMLQLADKWPRWSPGVGLAPIATQA